MLTRRHLLVAPVALVLGACATDPGRFESNHLTGPLRRIDSLFVASSLAADLGSEFGQAFATALQERLRQRGVRLELVSPAQASEFALLDFAARARAASASFTLLAQAVQSARLGGGVRRAEVDLSLYDNTSDRRVWRGNAPLGGAPLWRNSANADAGTRLAADLVERLGADGLLP